VFNTHIVANYSQHGGLSSERARKLGSLLCDFCELVERDELETTAILYRDGGVFWFMKRINKERGSTRCQYIPMPSLECVCASRSIKYFGSWSQIQVVCVI